MNKLRGKRIAINPYSDYNDSFKEKLYKLSKYIIKNYYKEIQYNNNNNNIKKYFDKYFDFKDLNNNILNDLLTKETYSKDKWKYICNELLE